VTDTLEDLKAKAPVYLQLLQTELYTAMMYEFFYVHDYSTHVLAALPALKPFQLKLMTILLLMLLPLRFPKESRLSAIMPMNPPLLWMLSTNDLCPSGDNLSVSVA
jgi:hypothetical protein